MQTIIAYRNPLEAYLWESGAVSMLGFWMLVNIVSIILFCGIYDNLVPRGIKYKNKIRGQYVVIGSCVILSTYLTYRLFS